MSDVAVPEELFFNAFLWECFHHPHSHPGSKFTLHPHAPEDHDGWHVLEPAGACYWGSLLWMGEVVYRIGEYEADVDSWWARWPD